MYFDPESSCIYYDDFNKLQATMARMQAELQLAVQGRAECGRMIRDTINYVQRSPAQIHANAELMYRCSALSSPMPGIAQPYKKKLTLAELDRILFPFDPIRDWSDREVARIEAKYAWLDRYQ